MECNIYILENKLRQSFKHCAEKELMINNVCDSVKKCGIEYKKALEILEKAFSEIIGLPFIGIVGRHGSYYYLQFPLFEDIADMTIDVIGSTLPQTHKIVNVKREHNLRLHVKLSNETSHDFEYKQVEIVLKSLKKERNTFFVECYLPNFPHKYSEKVEIAKIISL